MSSVRKIVRTIASVTLVVGLVLAVMYHQELRDQWTVWRNQPPEAIIELGQRSGLSDRGKFYLYAGKAELASAEVFNDGCERTERSTPILGCYVSGEDKIYIYDILDIRLTGIKEVTAAHEMLHVAYSRLSSAERQRLADLLEAAYSSHKTTEFEKRMAYYAESEPGSRVNELHSIIGTELRDIGPELEAYYARYFTDRQKTVTLYGAYQSVFTDIEQEVERLREMLQSWLLDIEQDQTIYETEIAAYQAAVVSFNQRAESGNFLSHSAFDSERAALIAQSDVLTRQRQDIEFKVAEYNANVEKINQLGGQMSELTKHLDSFEEMSR